MSTTLTRHRVLKVPCYTFHDAFLGYQHLLEGVLPTELRGVNARLPGIRDRFARAAVGWIRYKPLLTYITQPENYERIIADVGRKLDSAVPKLCAYFGTRQFEEIPVELARYHKNVKRHYMAFSATRGAFAKVTRASLPGRPARQPVRT
jgi:hypothetical protein